MSTPAPTDRDALLAALTDALRDVSGLSVLFSQSIADRLGIGSTDLETLGILSREGPVTAGRLAELTGLTTGAVTGLVDRLERAGYVRRESDPSDRRRVIISWNSEREAELLPLFASMQRSMERLYSRYTDAELSLILDFIRRATATTQAEIARVRELALPDTAAKERASGC